MRTSSLLALPLLLLAACAQRPAQTQDTSGPFVRGTARVLSIDPTLGHLELDFQNQRVQAYWQTEQSFAQGGTIVQTDSLKPAVGQYREPDIRAQGIDAKPGDTIQFVGMRTGTSIFLQGVAVIPH